MLGREPEAKALERSTNDSDSNIPKILSQFFYGINFMRKAKYEEGKKLFIKNFYLGRKEKTALFYSLQGLAFYQYYLNNFKASKYYAYKALESCENSSLDFEKIYALDILGHSHFQDGDFAGSQKFLETAEQMAKNLKCNSTGQAIEISRLGYSLEVGHSSHKESNSIEKANELIKESSAKEFYLRGQLYLQLAKAYFLQGDIQQMENTLQEASFTVYKTNNKRQLVNLNLSVAYAAYLSRDYNKALLQLNNASSLIDPLADLTLLYKCNGLIKNILDKLDKSEEHFTVPSFEFPNYREMLKNKTKITSSLLSDPISLFLKDQDLENFPTREVFLKALEKNLLGILNVWKPIQVNDYIVFGINETPKDRRVLICFKGSIVYSPQLTNGQYQILKLMFSKRNLSRKQIIENFWGYEYDSFIHDPLLNGSFQRLKNKFPFLKNFLFFNSMGEVNLKDFKVIDFHQKEIETQKYFSGLSKIKPNILPEEINQDHSLNFRQIKSLELLKLGNSQSISPREYQQYFSVSRATSMRDLKEMKQKGLLIPIGRTRGIRYCLDLVKNNNP